MQVAVLKAVSPIRLEHVVLGQYTASEDGSHPGYKDGEPHGWALRGVTAAVAAGLSRVGTLSPPHALSSSMMTLHEHF